MVKKSGIDGINKKIWKVSNGLVFVFPHLNAPPYF